MFRLDKQVERNLFMSNTVIIAKTCPTRNKACPKAVVNRKEPIITFGLAKLQSGEWTKEQFEDYINPVDVCCRDIECSC